MKHVFSLFVFLLAAMAMNAQEIIENGQVLILRNNKRYNALGVLMQ